MNEMLKFEGKVVVITCAGSGLGRAYALEFARRGAKVLINDNKTIPHEDSSKPPHKPADDVVNIIKSFGGVAVANYDFPEHGEQIVQCALDTFGQIDVLINNASLVHNASLLRMSTSDWTQVMNITLKGAFTASKSAFQAMKNQNYGRIINISSGIGLYGSLNHSSFSAASFAMHGITQVLSKSGPKFNILINTVSPFASTKQTQDFLTADIQDLLKPEKVVPLIISLCHESSIENGELFEASGGWFSKTRWQRADGLFVKGKDFMDDMRKRWNKVVDFGKADYPSSTQDSLARVDAERPKI